MRATFSTPGISKMSTAVQTTASLPDDPALLRVEGPIATITLNRPAAFNSIDLSIARKLEALGAEVEASGRHQGAGDRRRRPRVLRRRRFADHRRCRRRRHHRARGRRTAQALPRLHRDRAADAEDRAGERARLGGRRGHVAGLRRRPLHRRRRCPLHAGLRQDSAYRRTAAARSAWSASVGVRRALQILLAEDSFSAAAGLSMGSGRQSRSGQRARKAATRELGARGWRRMRRPRSPAPKR